MTKKNKVTIDDLKKKGIETTKVADIKLEDNSDFLKVEKLENSKLGEGEVYLEVVNDEVTNVSKNKNMLDFYPSGGFSYNPDGSIKGGVPSATNHDKYYQAKKDLSAGKTVEIHKTKADKNTIRNSNKLERDYQHNREKIPQESMKAYLEKMEPQHEKIKNNNKENQPQGSEAVNNC